MDDFLLFHSYGFKKGGFIFNGHQISRKSTCVNVEVEFYEEMDSEWGDSERLSGMPRRIQTDWANAILEKYLPNSDQYENYGLLTKLPYNEFSDRLYEEGWGDAKITCNIDDWTIYIRVYSKFKLKF